MAGKVKFRKCPECGNKMILKKSRKYNSKFWACSSFPDCEKTAEYNGPGANAGHDLNIREIENGLIITLIQKYPDENSDDEPRDIYCSGVEDLETKLRGLLDEQLDELIRKVKSSEDFDEEPDPKVKKKRVQTVKRGETDINALLKRHQAAKKRAKNPGDDE